MTLVGSKLPTLETAGIHGHDHTATLLRDINGQTVGAASS
jgi:hypothetical protein